MIVLMSAKRSNSGLHVVSKNDDDATFFPLTAAAAADASDHNLQPLFIATFALILHSGGGAEATI